MKRYTEEEFLRLDYSWSSLKLLSKKTIIIEQLRLARIKNNTLGNINNIGFYDFKNHKSRLSNSRLAPKTRLNDLDYSNISIDNKCWFLINHTTYLSNS